jgi:hypothetical protein
MGFQLVKNDMNVNEHDRRVCIQGTQVLAMSYTAFLFDFLR